MSRKRRIRYVVVENLPGCLPSADPAYFTSKREALSYMASEARFARDQGYEVSGNAEHGYEIGPNVLNWDYVSEDDVEDIEKGMLLLG